MTKSKIVVVNDNDDEVGFRLREDVDKENLRYRVSGLWLFNSKGDCLLAKRASTKAHDPGKWGSAVAGTVDEGGTYEANIIKEAEEELGIKNIKAEKGPKERIGGKHRYFVQWFTCVIDKPTEEFVVQEEEVDEVAWFSEEEFKSRLESNPEKFISTMSRCLDLFYS